MQHSYNKTTAMLLSGKTFDELACAKFCVSCGEKTVVCPHKITKSDLVVTLPNGCSHIKLSRPMVRVSLPALQPQGYVDQMYTDTTT